MNNALVVIAVLAACGGSKGSSIGNTEPATGSGTPASCPLPAAADVEDRFPVGAIPVARVEGMSHGARCYDVFVPGDVVVAEGTGFRIVKEGVFEGHCPDEPDNRRKYQAYAPATALIEVNAMGTNEGELGLGKSITLLAATPDKVAGVIAHAGDSCGNQLTTGFKAEVTWTAGPGCDKVAKVVPYDVGSPVDPKSPEQQIAPLGPGTCTISATLFGVKGDVTVTVK